MSEKRADAPSEPRPPTPDTASIAHTELQPGADGKFKGQTIGIDVDRLEAYCGSLKWKIRPNAHTKEIVDKVRVIQRDYEINFKKLDKDPNVTTWDKEVEYEKATQGILELALIGFKYADAANHIDAGPGALGILSNEIRAFLVDFGGRAGQKHLQMLSRLATSNISPGSKG